MQPKVALTTSCRVNYGMIESQSCAPRTAGEQPRHCERPRPAVPAATVQSLHLHGSELPSAPPVPSSARIRGSAHGSTHRQTLISPGSQLRGDTVQVSKYILIYVPAMNGLLGIEHHRQHWQTTSWLSRYGQGKQAGSMAESQGRPSAYAGTC